MTKRCNTPPPHGHTAGVVSDKDVIRRESADDYSFVLFQFFADCRLILCKHGKQWVVQVRSAKKPNVGTWVGRKHVTSKSALLVVCSALNLVRDMSVAQKVLQLPEKVSEAAENG
jgi:hypothetical protein